MVSHHTPFKLDKWIYLYSFQWEPSFNFDVSKLSNCTTYLSSYLPKTPIKPHLVPLLLPSGMRGICSRSSSWQVGQCPAMHCTGNTTQGTPRISPSIVTGVRRLDLHWRTRIQACVQSQCGQGQPRLYRFTTLKLCDEGGGWDRKMPN